MKPAPPVTSSRIRASSPLVVLAPGKERAGNSLAQPSRSQATGRGPGLDLLASTSRSGLRSRRTSLPGMKSFDVAAVVSGGASGLGEATTRRLVARGAAVTILDLQEDRGQALAAELGGHTTFVRTDVTDEDSVQAAIAEATGKDRPLRIAINCAGIGWAQRTVGRGGEPHDLGAFTKIVMVNLVGTFNVLRLAAAAMSQTEPEEDGERGVVVNTASIAAYDGQIGQIAYAASKGGIVGLTLPAARDLSSVGVRVCTIAPGLVDTPLLGMLPEEARAALAAGIPFPKRLGRPDDFAQLAMDIVEHGYLNGEVVRMDGALRMAPK
jgi:NAD(P)-dependent dehydrogenase (short-subunit alcohol dehydrogenase family)